MDTDLNKLMAAEVANRNDYHWAIDFTVRVHPSLLEGAPTVCPGCGQEHDPEDDPAVLADTFVVGGGDDAEPLIERVRAHVYDEDKYGVRLEPGSFKLKGIRLMSVRQEI